MASERTADTTPASRAGSSDNDISLREHMQRQIDDRIEAEHRYFERVIADMWDRLNERFDAQRMAVDELKATTKDRFDSVNEFRAQLNDQANKFMHREESISRHERTSEQIGALTTRMENEMRLLRERFEQEVKQLRDRHEADAATTNSRLDLNQGQAVGAGRSWALLVGGVGFVATLVGVVATVIALMN